MMTMVTMMKLLFLFLSLEMQMIDNDEDQVGLRQHSATCVSRQERYEKKGNRAHLSPALVRIIIIE